MLNPRQIEAFRAVILTGSATAAANLLGMTQPAVSRLVQDLEHRLRMTLFSRGGGKLLPTGDALTLYREVERSFIGLERIETLARDLRERRGGALRVAALPALAVGFLPLFAAKFMSDHPTVDVALHGMNSPQVLDWVSTGQCDLGIVGEQFQHTAIATRDLPSVRAVAVLPAAHELADREALVPQDFDGEDFIAIASPSLIRHKIEAVMTAEKVQLRIRAETPLTMIACGMVTAGFGCSIVDPFTAERYAGPNIAIKPFLPKISFDWGIITPSFANMSSIAIEFVDAFVADFGAACLRADRARQPSEA